MSLFSGKFARDHLLVLSLIRSQQTLHLPTIIGHFHLEVTSPRIPFHVLLCLSLRLQANDKVVSTLCILDSQATLGKERGIL